MPRGEVAVRNDIESCFGQENLGKIRLLLKNLSQKLLKFWDSLICFSNHGVKHLLELRFGSNQIKRNRIPSWRSDLFIKEFWLRKFGFMFLGIKICFGPNICKHFIVKINSGLSKVFAVRVRIEDFFL
ncbi:hypothetical protein BSK20_02880 [SR1 bacterium human oral taxon HOT-345]|nr:hypothetical protein BSK20_02880 [SR1 bacterium human oral taxon HOT-345]